MSYFNKKQIFALAIFLGLFFPVFAQQTQVNDDIKPFTGSSAFRKFSIGINGGVLNPSVVFGGSNDFSAPQYTLGYGGNLRYQLNHYLAIQGDFLMGDVKGKQNSKYGPGRPIASFDTKIKWAGSLSGVITFDNINWLNTKNHVIPYLSAGIGFMDYTTKIVMAGTSNQVDFSDPNAPKHPMFVPVGAGLKFLLSRGINLDLGYRMNFVDGDNFDGSPYYTTGTNPTNSSTVHKDKFSYGFVGLEFALGNRSKPQLMFDNPAARVNSYLQTQIDTVKANQAKLFVDTDGDGVPDYLDKEPNTPKGCAVDVHGVSLDTDGDGVPDCRDKELITPTQCQPVDADGVGKCPEPDCCKNMVAKDTNSCSIGDLPSISFKGNNNRLSSDAKAMLATVGSKLKNSASCSITINGYPAASKASQALCNKRLDMIKSYLVETEGIGADRITTNCEVGGGDANTVDIKAK
ncbi:MAG: outer membrane beta-barrel protein [Bacteroidota bacterium]|nr:outer membrane beta-barrel protein [Bacteroidota bacterium]